MFRPKSASSDDERVRKVEEFLISFFPEASSQRMTLFAKALVEAPDWGPALYHYGARDVGSLKNMANALKRAKKSINEVSPWVETGLETAVHQRYMNKLEPEPMPIPTKTDDMMVALEWWISATDIVEDMMRDWRPSHGKSVRAMAMIEDARKTWTAITGKDAPPKRLRVDSRFGRYLKGVFDAVGVHADLANAYNAWASNAYDPDGLLESPRPK